MANFGGNGPIDYSSMIQAPDFGASIAQGFQLGAGIREIQQKRIDRELERDLARQYQTDIQDYFANPTAQGISQLTAKYPKQAEQLQKAWATLDEASKNQERRLFGEVNSAFVAGRPDLAGQSLMTHIEALKNTGKPVPPLYQAIADLAATDPKKAQAATLYLHANTDPKHFDSTILTAPSSMKKAGAEADSAVSESQIKAVDAENATTKTELANQKAAEDIISAQNKREIDRLTVEIGQANSETQRGELILKRDELLQKQAEKNQEKGVAAQDALDSADALLAQIQGVKDHPGLNAGTGTLSGIRSFFNSSDANDFRKAVEGLKSPVFLNELTKLKQAGVSLGQVTEVEGAKLERRIANLDPDQSTPAFKNQVGVLLKDTQKFIEKIKASGKLPTSGGAFVQMVPGIGKVTEGDINRLLTQNPGSTREQAIQYLQTLGRK
jgi:hypothetical protein